MHQTSQLLRKSEVRSPCNWSALGATPVLLAAVEFHSPGCGYGWVKGEWECRGRSAVYMTTCAFVFASLRSSCSVGGRRALFLTTTCAFVFASLRSSCSFACCSDDVQLCASRLFKSRTVELVHTGASQETRMSKTCQKLFNMSRRQTHHGQG